MKVLWFVNAPLPEMKECSGLKKEFMGCWVSALKEALIHTPLFQPGSDAQLGIACSSIDFAHYQRFDPGAVSYFCLPKSRMCEYLQNYEQEITYCIRAINEFNPDIIHVHGTEEFYGLIKDKIKKPVVVSIQGILSVITNVYFGNMKWKNILLTPSVMKHFIMMKRKTKTERKIFSMNRYFIGRTLWDKSHLMSLTNGNCVYFPCHEVMRKEFYEKKWTLEDTIPGRLICISSPYAYKGVDSLIEAIGYIKKRLSNVLLTIYGSFPDYGYGSFLREKIKKLDLTDTICYCGFKNASELSYELTKARAFVIASHIENSSNSFQEAMLVGTPSVVPFTGGIPSIGEDGTTCLMYPRGDVQVMAECLYRVLTDDRLARDISEAGRKMAKKRNDPEIIALKMIEIYENIIKNKV